MSSLRPFQIVMLTAFALAGIVSLVLLSSYSGGKSSTADSPYGDSVEIWGTLSKDAFNNTIGKLSEEDKYFSVVQYIEKDPRTFEEELVNAIAENRSPDAIVLEHGDLVTYRPKLKVIPYETYPLRTFKDTYVDGAEIFALEDGVYALPLVVDPLVMYWNRGLFATRGLAEAPTTWEAVDTVIRELTIFDASRGILQSAIAFGEYSNVVNAKAILLTLLAQSGSRLVEEDGLNYEVALNDSATTGGRSPLTATLQYYTDFSNPNSSRYSWDRSRTSDKGAFVAGELALYFGFGSETDELLDLNPNLNFDVTGMPQGTGATVKRTYGNFYGLAILEASDNQLGTYRALQKLTSPDAASFILEKIGLAPANRKLITSGSSNPWQQVSYNSALVAAGWLDPDQNKSDEIFAEMVAGVVSNRVKVTEAASEAAQRLRLAF